MDQITSRKPKDECESLGSQRVYKKTSANSVLTLYLGSRDLISRRGVVKPLRGVIYIDPKFMCSQKIYGQLTLTFRYGREDEEVMGLKFCNEAVISLKQIWPKVNYDGDDITPLQQALVNRLGQGAYPFTLEIGMLAPPSVQLIPAKKYNGAPIGTSYDIRVFMSDLTDEKFQRRTTVKLGIRLMHKIPSDLRAIQQTNPTFTSLPKSIRLRLSPKQLKFHHQKNSHQQNATTTNSTTTQTATTTSFGFAEDYTITNNFTRITTPTTSTLKNSLANSISPSITNCIENINGTGNSSGSAGDGSVGTSSTSTISRNSLKGPEGCVDKPFLWTEGRVSLKASLNKSAYGHEEKILINVDIRNKSRKVIRKLRVFAVQHVDVCMFSNGKFKNVVADINENQQIKPNETFTHTYEIIPVKGPTKNWIAVEGTYINSYTNPIEVNPQQQYKIASSAHRGPMTAEERNVFAIYVSYYVKVKLTLSGMGGEVSLKLPFILGHVTDDDDDDDDNNEDNNENDTSNKKTICSSNNNNNGKEIASTTSISTITTTLHTTTIAATKENGCGNKNIDGNRLRDSTIGITTTNSSRDNIIEEELHEDHDDTISLLNEDLDTIRKKDQQNDEKYIHERNLLQRYKLKRESYSKSCEDIIDSFSKGDSSGGSIGSRASTGIHTNAVKALIHRQDSETND